MNVHKLANVNKVLLGVMFVLHCTASCFNLFCIYSIVCIAYNVDLSSQLKAARQNAEVSRQELTEYKEKAARILQVHCIKSSFALSKHCGNIMHDGPNGTYFGLLILAFRE